MSFWQKLFSNPVQNQHKNHIACIENDCSCKSDQQLLEALTKTQDEDMIIGIKKVLVARGYSRKELNEIQHLPLQ